MEPTEAALPLLPGASLAELIAPLEQQLLSTVEETLEALQSLNQAGTLESQTLKTGVQNVLNLTKASLLIRSVPLFLNIPLTEGLTTQDLVQKSHQTTETLKELCQDQVRHLLAAKATQVLQQIELKEQQIRRQIEQKQQAIAQLVSETTKRATALASGPAKSRATES